MLENCFSNCEYELSITIQYNDIKCISVCNDKIIEQMNCSSFCVSNWLVENKNNVFDELVHYYHECVEFVFWQFQNKVHCNSMKKYRWK